MSEFIAKNTDPSWSESKDDFEDDDFVDLVFYTEHGQHNQILQRKLAGHYIASWYMWRDAVKCPWWRKAWLSIRHFRPIPLPPPTFALNVQSNDRSRTYSHFAVAWDKVVAMHIKPLDNVGELQRKHMAINLALAEQHLRDMREKWKDGEDE